MNVRSKAQDERATSSKILVAASRLFAEKGFSNVSIRDVCRESGTTAPVIYYYFGSKRGLFEAVVGGRISIRGFIDTLGRAAEDDNVAKGLELFVDSYLSHFPAEAFEPGLYLRDKATLDPKTAKMISADLDRIRTIASRLVQRSMDAGQFRKADPGMAADCLLGMLNRVIFQGIHFSKPSDKKAYGRFVIDFFLRAMKQPR